MEFTLESKLNHIFWQPIGPCLLETDKTDDAKLDQRRASTTHYKQHRDAIIELISMRDRAKAAGLDGEFKKIVRSIVPGGISTGTDLTRRNVFHIELKIIDNIGGQPSLKDKIEERERRMGVEVDDAGDTNLIDAMATLRASAPPDAEGRELGTPSFQELLNPHHEHHDPKKPLKIFYAAGPDHKRTPFVMDNSRNVLPQYEELIQIANQSAEFVPKAMQDDYMTFINSLTPLHDARVALIKAHMPDIDEKQAQYTATFYTARNAALDFERLEAERKKQYKDDLAIKTRDAKKKAKAAAKVDADKNEGEAPADAGDPSQSVEPTQSKGKVDIPKPKSRSQVVKKGEDIGDALGDLLGLPKKPKKQ